MLPNDLTPRQIGELAIQMAVMDSADFVKLALEHPERIRAVAFMAAVASGFMVGDEDA